MKKILEIIMIWGIIIFLPVWAQARDAGQITDWYVRDFQSTITVNDDASLLVEEKIIADCGNLPDKHGIFRILPVQTRTESGIIKTPIELVSITDFSGNKITYSTSVDNFNHTITYKIGDPNITIKGENEYKITYLVKNAIRARSNDFDELYWNLSGNFWDIEIDNFGAEIIFPAEINRNNSEVYLYSGGLGEKENLLANYQWKSDNILRVYSNKILMPRQGTTASIIFPKGIIASHKPNLFEAYGDYLWFLIPVLVFIFSFLIWNKHGKDPRIDKTIIPEFEIPQNLTPMEMGMLAQNGGFNDKFITATIVDLAVKKYIIIEEIPKKGIFGKQDFYLKKISADFSELGNPEKTLIDKIFVAKQEVLLSKLKNNFYKDLPSIKKSAATALENKDLIYPGGQVLKITFIIIGMTVLGFGIFMLNFGFYWIIAILLSAIILEFFGILMPKRTPQGAELNWRIKGFKLYMETAEKYRARFYEKENIFEKFLPYAIMFGITKLWIKKMEEIYGKEYFNNYHPIWYAGAITSFNADSFSSQINTLSSGIASNIGTASGAHGTGGAGGGGGGGGGGGW